MARLTPSGSKRLAQARFAALRALRSNLTIAMDGFGDHRPAEMPVVCARQGLAVDRFEHDRSNEGGRAERRWLTARWRPPAGAGSRYGPRCTRSGSRGEPGAQLARRLRTSPQPTSPRIGDDEERPRQWVRALSSSRGGHLVSPPRRLLDPARSGSRGESAASATMRQSSASFQSLLVLGRPKQHWSPARTTLPLSPVCLLEPSKHPADRPAPHVTKRACRCAARRHCRWSSAASLCFATLSADARAMKAATTLARAPRASATSSSVPSARDACFCVLDGASARATPPRSRWYRAAQ